MKKLSHAVTDATKSPQIDLFHDFYVVLQGAEVKSVQQELIDEKPEWVSQ